MKISVLIDWAKTKRSNRIQQTVKEKEKKRVEYHSSDLPFAILTPSQPPSPSLLGVFYGRLLLCA